MRSWLPAWGAVGLAVLAVGCSTAGSSADVVGEDGDVVADAAADADDGAVGDVTADVLVPDGGTDAEVGPADAPEVEEADVEEVDVGGEEPAGCPLVPCDGVEGPCSSVACDEATGACVTTPSPDGTPCDDGNACSATDGCAGGTCVGLTALACDDANPCTDDACAPEVGCVYVANFAACDDGDPCTAGDACVDAACLPGGPACDDDDPCTTATCDPLTGDCTVSLDDGAPCDDGSACTAGDACTAGACVPGSGDGCDDGNACTEDVCTGVVDCAHVALDDGPCDDGDACTTGDACSGGLCVFTAPTVCDDGDPCTADACSMLTGCAAVITPGATCDDGDVCTALGVCDDEGGCVAGALTDCDDGNPCTKEACDPALGCQYIVKLGVCDDGDACTGSEICKGLVCEGEPVDCDDEDACTLDTCDTILGCQHLDVSAGCDDGDPCTEDGCDADAGCVAAPTGEPCDDGSACTLADVCGVGGCAGTAIACDDGDPCTQDGCDPESGCVTAPWLGPCDDGDACTSGETCDGGGVCGGGAAVDVSDAVACTIDGCDPAVGPTHTPSDVLCGLGKACYPIVGCVAGDVRVMVTKVLLWPSEEAPTDGAGQWLAVHNVGDVPVDLVDVTLRNAAGQEAALGAAEGGGSVVLEPAQTRAGALATADGTPGDFSFVVGEGGDGFLLGASGDVLELVFDTGDVLDTLDFGPVTQGPAVAPGTYPIIPGAPTELALAAVATAKDAEDNDIADQWCVWPEGTGAPEEPTIACSRIRLNEVGLAGDDGGRWVELHAPSGARLDGSMLHLVQPDGTSAGFVTVPSGRAPIGLRSVMVDGLAAVAFPPMTEGSVQLLRQSVLLDVYGFGAIEATQDSVWGYPLVESSAGIALANGLAAIRLPDGADTDDAAVDWVTVPGGSPGKINGP